MDFSSEEKQRAVWKGSSPAGCLHIDAEEYCHLHCWINHSRHCCFMAGATSQKEAWQHHHRGLQNDTALIAEEGRRGLGGGFLEARRDEFRYVTVKHLHLHISLLYSCVGAAGDIWSHAGSIRKTTACSRSLAWVVSIWLHTPHASFLDAHSHTVALMSRFSHINMWFMRKHRSFIQCTHLLCMSLWEKSEYLLEIPVENITSLETLSDDTDWTVVVGTDGFMETGRRPDTNLLLLSCEESAVNKPKTLWSRVTYFYISKLDRNTSSQSKIALFCFV